MSESSNRALDGSQPQRLKDNDLMPFGQHEGRKIGDVPADYLLWCYRQAWVKQKFPELWAYIEQGRAFLEKEAKEKR